MRLVLSLIIVVHGFIHVMGFAKAFKYAELSQLTQEISKSAGLLWLLCAIAFIAAGVLFAAKQSSWWWIALPAVILSQWLMFASWEDSKFGTIANLIILLPIVAVVLEALPAVISISTEQPPARVWPAVPRCPFVTESDLGHFPARCRSICGSPAPWAGPGSTTSGPCSQASSATGWRAPG